nr:amidohydrolase family protein [uncultured Dethiosulfovibrio sp.]
MYDLVVKDGMIITASGPLFADIALENGKIAALGEKLKGRQELNAQGLMVLPGVVDAHVHLDLPVRGDRSSDDFLSGTGAALAGGVTTVVDFTVGSGGTTMLEDLESRLETARPAVADYSFHCEVIGWRPGKEDQIAQAVERGVTSFKFFIAYGDSGRRSDGGTLFRCFSKIAELGAVAVVHAEDDELIRALTSELSEEQKGSMRALARTRPDICEGAAIDQVAFYGEATGASVHVVHVSSGLGASRIDLARRRGVDITGETCPQYLFLTDEVYDRPDGHLYSASPALRSNRDRQALWSSLNSGVLDFVATDHCPFTKGQKTWKGSFSDLPYGLPGVELLLPLVYQGVLKGLIPVEHLPLILSQAPADRYGLTGKGRIVPGYDGDLVIFDPSAKWTVRAEDLHMNVDFSPYEGMEIQGKVLTTISRGEVVFRDGAIHCDPGRGRFIPRKPRPTVP